MEYQTSPPLDGYFASPYIVQTTTKQEQMPGAAYVIEGASPTSLTQDRSMYFIAC